MMDGDTMGLDEVDVRSMVASRRSNAEGSDCGMRSSNTLDFSSVVERILSTLEERGDYHKPNHGPLSPTELSRLSMLCSQQQQRCTKNKMNIADPSCVDNDGNDNDHLGFVDVSVETMLQLVEYLEKHVALASGVNFVHSAFQEIQNIHANGGCKNMDQVCFIKCYDSRTICQTFSNFTITFLMSFQKWIGSTGEDFVEILSSGLEAAAILLFIVTSPGIDRRVMNEDAIGASIVLMKCHLIHNLIPAINNTGHILMSLKENVQLVGTNKKRRRSSAGVSSVDSATIREMRKSYKIVMPTITGTVLLMERLTILIQRVPLDDQHLLTCSAGALASLELEPSSNTYKIHVAAFGLVTSIFRQYPKMREFIIQDLLPLMLLMPAGKKTMRSYTIQISPVMFPECVQKLSRSLVAGESADTLSLMASCRTNMQPLSILILDLVQSAVVRPTYEKNQGDGENYSVQKRNTGLGNCQLVSNLFVRHLMHRCAQKGEEGGASDFRPILSNLIDDLLLVVFRPEYPAAEMILLDIVNTITRTLQSIVERKAKRGVEETYLNTIFDALGRICSAEARIRNWGRTHPIRDPPPLRKNNGVRRFNCYCEKEESGERYMLNCDRCETWFHGDCVGISRETQPDRWFCDGCQLGEIVGIEREHNTKLGDLGCPSEFIGLSYCVRRLLLDQLSCLFEKTEQTGVKDAYQFHLARWLNSLGLSTSQAPQKKQQVEESVNMAFATFLFDIWDPGDLQHERGGLTREMLLLSDEGRGRLMVNEITNLSGLLNSFQSQLAYILGLLNESNTKFRKLSLKAIERIADADPSLMLKSKFRKAVFHRFTDEAISVREAVVSLVGNYVIRSPEVANAFHDALVVGLADPGISVKKRTVNVLHSILCNNPSYKGRAEACSIMLRLAADPKEDDSVRDLVHDLFSSIWLENGEDPVQDIRLDSPRMTTPTSRVSNMEFLGTATPGDTSASKTIEISSGARTPIAWSSVPRNSRSTVRRTRSRHMRYRCEVAAEQMVEVVKEANSGEGLTLLFRELTCDVLDSDKTKQASARKKRQGLAREQSITLIDALFDMLLALEDDPTIQKFERGREFVAIFRVTQVFADVAPLGILKHLDTLLPYLKLDNGVELQHEEEIAASLCPIFSRIIPDLDQQNLLKLAEESVADDLVRIAMNLGRAATSSAVESLCLLADHNRAVVDIFQEKLLHLSRIFFVYLDNHKNQESAGGPRKARAKANLKRALGVMGSICRFHVHEASSFDSMGIDRKFENALSLANIAPLCESMFLNFFGKEEDITRAALRAMVGIFLSHPKELLRMEQDGLIAKVMGPCSPEKVQLESLLCWRDILLAEELRVDGGAAKAKMDSKKTITTSKKVSGDQDSDAILCGGILTMHAFRIFEMTESRDASIRYAAVDLTGLLLRQGQLNPSDAVPYMMAVQGDVEEGIRKRALQILIIEGHKRPDVVRQRLCSGIKRSYLFQKTVHPDIQEVTALITVKREGTEEKECVFGSVYKECVANIKKQRRSLLRNLVRLLDLSSNADSATSRNTGWLMDLELLSYTSQVLAYLPYGFPSDVLFVIRLSDGIISRCGNELLEKLTDYLRPHGFVTEKGLAVVDEEDDVIEQAARRRVPHHAKEATGLVDLSFDVVGFAKMCNDAGSIILLLRLKSFLQQLYGLSRLRCNQFDPDKGSIEKPLLKIATCSIFPSKLPMQGKKMSDDNDLLDAAISQYAQFRQLMREELREMASVMDQSISIVGAENDRHGDPRQSGDGEVIEGSKSPRSKRVRSKR
jgi:cohesin loading factor subunit SCC2